MQGDQEGLKSHVIPKWFLCDSHFQMGGKGSRQQNNGEWRNADHALQSKATSEEKRILIPPIPNLSIIINS